MTKFITRGLLATFIIAIVFTFNIFVPKAEAQTAGGSSLCQIIETLIIAGVIPPDKAPAARAATGCPTSAPAVEISFVEKSLTVVSNDSGQDYAVGTFKFKLTPTAQDIQVASVQSRGTVNVLQNGQVVGKVASVTLVSDVNPKSDVFLVREGETQVFTLSYVVEPLNGSGNYNTRALYILLTNGQEILIDSPDSQYISGHVFLRGSATTSATATVNSANMVLTYNASTSESQLSSVFMVVVSAGPSDLYLYTDIAEVSLLDQNNNRTVVNSTQVYINMPVDKKTDAYGRNYTVIPAGSKVELAVNLRAMIAELFAGSYHATLKSLAIANASDYNKVAVNYLPVTSNETNSVLVVGEVSPYINSAETITNTDGTKVLNILGVRLEGSNAFYSCGSVSGDVINISSKVRTDQMSLDITNLPTGVNCSVVLNDPKTGQSNRIGFTVPASSVTNLYSKAFSGTVAGLKILDLEKTVNVETLAINWTDNGQKCQATIQTSLDKVYWKTAKFEMDVASPGNFTLSKLGNVRYISFTSLNCKSLVLNLVSVKGVINEKVVIPTPSPKINIKRPNGGETYKAGETMSIDWSTSYFPPDANVYIELRPDNFNIGEYVKIAVTRAINDSYDWQIPDDIKPANYRVEIYLADKNDGVSESPSAKTISESPFRIIDSSSEPVVCSSFTYSPWSVCSNGEQTRNVVSKFPAGCVHGEPEVSQTCEVPPVAEKYSRTLSGTVVASQIFDLERIVDVTSAVVKWTDNGQKCQGAVQTSSDAKTWTTKKALTDVASPGGFVLAKLGKLKYFKFLEEGCAGYNLTSLDVAGTY